MLLGQPDQYWIDLVTQLEERALFLPPERREKQRQTARDILKALELDRLKHPRAVSLGRSAAEIPD